MDATGATTVHKIGELCVDGDWACASGDLEALETIARQLATYVHEPLHCKLAVLADMCRLDPDNAVAAWMHLKEQILGDNGSPPHNGSPPP